MEEKNFLKHFITEDIYLIPGEEVKTSDLTSPEDKPIQTEATPAEESAETITEEVIVATPKIPANDKADAGINETYTPPVYSGLFAKQVLVIVQEKGLKFEGQEFLLKILSSVNLAKEDIAIVPTGHIETKEDFQWLMQLGKKQTFAFGLSLQWMKRLHTSTEKYVNMPNSGGMILFADSLNELNNNLELKKKLWAQLKLISNG